MPKSVTFDREQVVRNVMDLFWKKGYNGTSMQDLVDVTGLNRSSFYNSFGDKFSLFEESLTYYQTLQLDHLSHTLVGYKSPKEAISSLLKGISDDVAQGDQKGCMISNCIAELSADHPKVKTFLVSHKERVVNIFLSLIQKAQTLGEIDSDKDSKTLALYLFMSLHGLRITSMLDTELEGVTDQIINSL